MTELLASLNEQQAKAVEQTNGPILILAGAGSGKTKVLTTKIAYLLEKGVKPYSILAITFTNKAAKEMRQRVDALVGPAAKDVWLYTFHGFCNQLLRRDIQHLPGGSYTSDFSIYDTTDCKNVLKEVLKAMNLDEKFYPPAGGAFGHFQRQKRPYGTGPGGTHCPGLPPEKAGRNLPAVYAAHEAEQRCGL